MKVIVTGVTGFIGRPLVEALLQRGDQVVTLTRNPGRALSRLPIDVQTLEWRPPELGPWTEAFTRADAVINLAGEPVANKRWTAEQKEEILSSRVDATNAVVEAIGQANPRPSVLLNASAIGYYGPQGTRELTESSPNGEDFLAYVVREWEAAAKKVEAFGVRLVLLRTGIVLGNGGGALPPMVLPFRFFGGGIMGRPDQWVSWIHLDDEIGLILYALDHDTVRGPLNLTAPNPVTMSIFSRQIGRSLNRPTWVPMLHVPMTLVLGRERAQAMMSSQRVLPRAAEALGYRYQHVDSGEALSSLLSRS
jgi:uncharacterized protein (TIGR01777 family)